MMSRTSDQHDIRIFRAEPSSRLEELYYTEFDKESQLQKLVEENIGTLFHGLTFLGSEFPELDDGRHRLDTVAFDTKRDTFAVIEYKNKQDPGVISQTKAYLGRMNANKHALMSAYVSSRGRKGSLDTKSYNWNEMYAIVMAPEFDKYSLENNDSDLELYEIRQYSKGVVMMRRVGGAHERSADDSKTPQGGTGAAPSYETIRERLLAEFPGAEVNEKPEQYNGFRYPGRSYFCTAEGKRQIVLYYSGNKSIKIRSMDDLERAVADMKTLVGT